MNEDKHYIAVENLGQKFAQTHFIAHTWQSPNWHRPVLVKPYAQMFYVAAGYGTLMIAGQHFEMRPNYLFIIEKNQLSGEISDPHNSLDIWFCYISEQEYPELLSDGLFLPPKVNPCLDFRLHQEYTLAALRKAEQLFYHNTCDSVRLGKLLIRSVSELAKSMYRDQPANFSFPPENLELRILHYLYDHYGEKVTLDGLAAHFGFSPAHLSRRFSAYWGFGPLRCLLEIRMIEARMLLCNTELPIQEIAKRVGYEDIHYFIRLFAKKQGVSPGQYRNTYTDIPSID